MRAKISCSSCNISFSAVNLMTYVHCIYIHVYTARGQYTVPLRLNGVNSTGSADPLRAALPAANNNNVDGRAAIRCKNAGHSNRTPATIACVSPCEPAGGSACAPACVSPCGPAGGSPCGPAGGAACVPAGGTAQGQSVRARSVRAVDETTPRRERSRKRATKEL